MAKVSYMDVVRYLERKGLDVPKESFRITVTPKMIEIWTNVREPNTGRLVMDKDVPIPKVHKYRYDDEGVNVEPL